MIEISELLDVESLVTAVQQGCQPKYIFFWGHQPAVNGRITKTCLSQWWPASFEVEGVIYKTAEHFMMAEKARLFHDEPAWGQIVAAGHPGEAKNIGRGVRGFDIQTWHQHRFDIVVRGNIAKFSQNEELQTYLMNTCNRVLVEASPVDKIWGIGLAEDDVRAQDPAAWQGLNLLGFALMTARNKLAQNSNN